MSWLLRQGDVLATAELVSNNRSLRGRSGCDGAVVLLRARAVHTIGMRFGIDVAFCDHDMVVIDVTSLRPWRMSLPRRRGRSVVEAQAGSFERWGLRVGDQLELRG